LQKLIHASFQQNDGEVTLNWTLSWNWEPYLMTFHVIFGRTSFAKLQTLKRVLGLQCYPERLVPVARPLGLAGDHLCPGVRAAVIFPERNTVSVPSPIITMAVIFVKLLSSITDLNLTQNGSHYGPECLMYWSVKKNNLMWKCCWQLKCLMRGAVDFWRICQAFEGRRNVVVPSDLMQRSPYRIKRKFSESDSIGWLRTPTFYSLMTDM
jgi:hypothetical protein